GLRRAVRRRGNQWQSWLACLGGLALRCGKELDRRAIRKVSALPRQLRLPALVRADRADLSGHRRRGSPERAKRARPGARFLPKWKRSSAAPERGNIEEGRRKVRQP